MFVIQHSYKAATQQQYPLSPETYSDSASLRPSWQPDVGVYFGVGFSQEDRAWIVCSKPFDQGIGEDIPQSSSSSSVIPCMLSCTGTSCWSNRWTTPIAASNFRTIFNCLHILHVTERNSTNFSVQGTYNI